MVNDHLFTLKIGGLAALVGWGRYARVAVSNFEPGRTEVWAKAFAYGAGDRGPAPDTDVERGRQQLERLRTALGGALDGDLKIRVLP
jgi:hypothetical protein